MTTATRNLQAPWARIGPVLSIRSERDYDRAVERLNQLLDEVGANESHPLYGRLDALGTMIEAWERDHYALPEQSGAQALRFLMEEHGLKQSELPEVGSQGVVSEVLRGRRELNVRQVRALAKRFGVSPAVFI